MQALLEKGILRGMRGGRTWIRVALLVQLSCASGGGSNDAELVAESTATSSSGRLQVTARTIDGEPPARGANSFEIEIVRSDGGAATQSGIEAVTPWMPAMGHGTSARPTVAEIGEGRYRVDSVLLFMPGLWELRVSIAEPFEDDAAPRFQIR